MFTAVPTSGLITLFATWFFPIFELAIILTLKTNHLKPAFLIVFFIISFSLNAQDSSKIDRALSFPDKLFGVLNKKATSLEAKIDKQIERYLSRVQKQEFRLQKKIMRKDSALAHSLFDNVSEKYNALSNKATQVSSQTISYSGRLDSLSTALNFLNQTKNIQAGNAQVHALLGKYKELQNSLNQADRVKAFITQRKQMLKEQFQKLGMVKQFKAYEKQVYYYRQQIAEYKEQLNDPEKIGEKLLMVAQKVPAFKDFFARNSVLGSLFALPGGRGSMPLASVAGLQTRAMINQSIINRFGNGVNVNQLMQQNIQSAQSQLNALKNQISSLSSGTVGNSSDKELPDFKPNSQKTKSFLKRIQIGVNVQSQKSTSFFPVMSNIGLSIGYKLNDKSILGIGSSLKVGWGSGWNNIKLTYQGLGLRSFLDYKIRKSLFLSGGYELNYMATFHTFQQLKNYSAWQRSGLLGIGKQYQVSKKIKGNMLLLWDFLSYEQIPHTQPIVFRIGYQFK